MSIRPCLIAHVYNGQSLPTWIGYFLCSIRLPLAGRWLGFFSELGRGSCRWICRFGVQQHYIFICIFVVFDLALFLLSFPTTPSTLSPISPFLTPSIKFSLICHYFSTVKCPIIFFYLNNCVNSFAKKSISFPLVKIQKEELVKIKVKTWLTSNDFNYLNDYTHKHMHALLKNDIKPVNGTLS